MSDKRRTKAQLLSELKYRTTFEASTDAIFLETLDGQVLDCNRAAQEMFGYTHKDCMRLKVTDLVPPEVAATLPQVITQELAAGGIFVKTTNKRKNGQLFPAEVSTQVVSLEGQPRVIVYVRDITDRARATESLTRRMQELAALYETLTLAAYAAIALDNARLYAAEQERATALARTLEQQHELDRLQREFVQIVSHELRMPLTIIRGHAEMLDSGWLGELQPDQRESVGVIARRTQLMTKLVDNLVGNAQVHSRRRARDGAAVSQQGCRRVASG